MKIYPAEEKMGLGPLIQEKATIRLTSKLSPALKKELIDLPKAQNLKASLLDWSDLYPVESILASTTVNLNDVLFSKEDVWAARSSAVDKPFNIEHDEFDIIGHIVSSKAVDDDMVEIDDDTPLDDLPAKFHILTSAVLYKHWADESRQKEINEIIAEIAADEWSVSMELLQNEFDYAIEKEPSVYQIIARTEDTAFLTKHLLLFGGTGTYKDQKLCIVPRNFIFSGVGLVKDPANPESVITNYGSVKEVELISIQAGVIPMDELEKVKAELETLKASLKKAELDKLTAAVTEAEATVTAAQTENAKLSAKIVELEASLKDTNVKLTASETEKSTLTASNATLVEKVAAFETESVKASRTNDLLGAGLDADKAKELAPIYAKLSDEDFKGILPSLVVAKDKVAPDPVEPDEDDKEKGKAKMKAAVDAIKNAEPTETVTLPKPDETPEVNAVFASCIDWYKSATPDDRTKPRNRRSK